VYVTDEQDVVTVVVDGQVLMRDSKLLLIDQALVRREATAIADKIRLELKIKGSVQVDGQ
jgi:hypothetical protein